MTTIILVLLAAAFCTEGWLRDRWRDRAKKAERETEKQRAQNASLKKSLECAHTNLMLLEQANYRMGCELYGKQQVDQAIRRAHEQGVN